jgi:hypothetical protein
MGQTTRIDTGDDRILSARRYAGDIWAVLSTSRPDGYAGLTVFKILTGGTIAWEFAGWGAEGCYYYYPAIAVDDWENIGLVFSRSCDDGYVGIRHTGMKIGESALEPSKLIKLGEAPYVNLDSGGVNRWGGYSGIERDPFDLFTFWMFDAYATARVGTGNNSGRWATWMYTAWYPPYSYDLPIVGRGY